MPLSKNDTHKNNNEGCTMSLKILISRQQKRYTTQGRTEKLKEGGAKLRRGANNGKKLSFCEILNKMTERGGGEEPSPPPPCTPMVWDILISYDSFPGVILIDPCNIIDSNIVVTNIKLHITKYTQS